MNTESIMHAENPSSLKKMQNEGSQGNQPEGETKKVPKYKAENFVQKVRQYLAPGSTMKRNQVASAGHKAFYDYCDALSEFCGILGPPGENADIQNEDRARVLEIIIAHECRRPLIFFANELWGVSVSRSDLKKTGGSADLVEATDKTTSVSEVEVVGDYVSLKKILFSLGQKKTRLDATEIGVFIDSLAGETESATDYTRSYLESMLSIGAALIFFRFQCGLLSAQEAKDVNRSLLEALNKRLKKQTRSALDSALGRIRRAYMTAMSVYLNEAEPKMGDKKALWAFYRKSMPEIPGLVTCYLKGDLARECLDGIPYVPLVAGAKREIKTAKPNSSQSPHIKNLKIMLNATERSQADPVVDFQDEFVDSTLFSLETLAILLEKEGAAAVEKHREEIEERIESVQRLLTR